MSSENSISNSVIWRLENQQLILRPDKTAYWPEEKTLIVSDLHIGKVMHFRRAGFAVPLETVRNNFERLSFILLNTDIEKVIFLGDLYHSSENNETALFWELLDKFPEISFILIKGNHDVHNAIHFEKRGMKVYDQLDWGPFSFTHEPKEQAEKLFNVAGHIHPAVRLRGKARGFLKLPCFYFNSWQGILPAFGAFTGTHSLSPQKDDQVFVIASEDRVIDISRI